MENVIAERVKEAKLTKVQRKIAEYFIQNPEKVGMSSSMEVAKAIGVSDASITRFARAIRYEGFTDLKNDIYSNLAMQATGGVNSLSLVDRFDSNQAEYASEDPCESYKKIVQFNLKWTFQNNSEEAFNQVVSMLAQAKHRYIIGFRGCLGLANQFAWMMRFLVDHVIAISDEGTGGIGSLQDITSEDCVLFFSLSRYYRSDQKLAQLAKKRGAQICLITNSSLSPLVGLADVVLLAQTRNAVFFNSTIALNVISEYLLTKLSQICSTRYRDLAAERDKLTEDLRL